jgi:hypothetical protein
MVFKILVNFETRKVGYTEEHRGSRMYITLKNKGFVEVGSFKMEEELKTGIHSKYTAYKEPKVFIEPEYFDPNDKYEPRI